MPEPDTPPFIVRRFELRDAEALTAYYERNREFHREWSPIFPPEFFSVAFQRRRLRMMEELSRQEREYRMGIFTTQEQGDRVIGAINLTAIERGAFHNGRLGYSIDGACQRRGIMTAGLRQVMAFAFRQLHLHRLEANIMPHNIASRRVLEKCGFSRIGCSPRMLMINGDWRDHEMYMILADDFGEHPASGVMD